jgi:hypothetical protein
MEVMRKSSIAAFGIACLIVSGCAGPSPKPVTHEQYLANRERAITKAVQSACRAGQDGEAVYERLELQACLYDAMALPELQQRSPAIQRCRVIWPQRWPATLASAP